MPYVGFHPVNDPGLRKARRGRKRTRRCVAECIPMVSMYYRLNHPIAEAVCFGRYLVPSDFMKHGQPLRVWAFGITQDAPLMIYYWVTWEPGN